jgi:hypothetical protein
MDVAATVDRLMRAASVLDPLQFRRVLRRYMKKFVGGGRLTPKSEISAKIILFHVLLHRVAEDLGCLPLDSLDSIKRLSRVTGDVVQELILAWKKIEVRTEVLVSLLDSLQCMDAFQVMATLLWRISISTAADGGVAQLKSQIPALASGMAELISLVAFMTMGLNEGHMMTRLLERVADSQVLDQVAHLSGQLGCVFDVMAQALLMFKFSEFPGITEEILRMLVVSKHAFRPLVKESVACADSNRINDRMIILPTLVIRIFNSIPIPVSEDEESIRDLFASQEFQDLMARLAAGCGPGAKSSRNKEGLVPREVIQRYVLHAWEICRTLA